MPPFIEPEWKMSEDTGTYHRALFGIEASHDTVHILADGCAEPCIGITFTYPRPREELIGSLKEALGRLRFVAPLMAAAITGELGQREWHYQCASDAAEVVAWAEKTLVYHDDGLSPDDFVVKATKNRAVYPAGTFNAQQFACHLLYHDTNKYSVFLQGTHSILDGQVTLDAIYCLFRSITLPEDETSVAHLDWGTEWKNLPTTVITTCGGPFPGHEEALVAISEKIKSITYSPTPPQGLHPQRENIMVQGHLHRVQRKIPAVEFSKILAWTKKRGFTITVLGEAAVVLATLEFGTGGETFPDDAHVTFDIVNVALQKYFVPPYNVRTRLASAMSQVCSSITARDAGAGPRCDQLGRIMPLLRAQYAGWLKNPHLPWMSAWAAPEAATNPFAPVISNIGIVEHSVPASWPIGNSTESLNVERLTIANRAAHLTRPALHAWTMAGEYNLQCQLSDMFDVEYMGAYVDRILEIMLAVLEAEGE